MDELFKQRVTTELQGAQSWRPKRVWVGHDAFASPKTCHIFGLLWLYEAFFSKGTVYYFIMFKFLDYMKAEFLWTDIISK